MSMNLIHLLKKDMILDACTAISLYATDQLPAILDCLPGDIYIASFVEKVEVKDLYNPITSAFDIKIDLTEVKNNGLLTVIPPPLGAEANDAVSFVAALSKAKPGKNTGEAISGAVAKSRNWVFATDDKEAITFFSEPAQKLELVTTFDIIQYWANAEGLSHDETRAILARIKAYARYGPPHRTHHLLAWWESFMLQE